ncbi:MAG: DUF1489 domain-containing protein [Acetobacteraceae bacterium]|nr:DUF1489 domain-containing protein [Acetobacteraceae bacterium]
MLHMTKLCVGIRDIADLRAHQQAHLARGEVLRHRTRSFPRRAAEIIDGGSLYWVIAGATVVRQRVVDIIADHWEDGSKCAGLIFDPALVAVAARTTRPFQGWRYLDPAAAPPDLLAGHDAEGSDALPPALRRALEDLGLL